MIPESLFLIGKIYVGAGCAFALLLIILSIFQLDRFEWKTLHKLDSLGVLLFSIMGWPFLIIHRPKSIFSARALIPVDYRSAAFHRETDRISNNLPYCSAYIKYVQHEKGIITAEYILKTEELTKLLAKPIKRFWVAQANDAIIYSWLQSADLTDNSPVEVPWVWTNFPILVDEMLTQGFGTVHCLACQRDFEASQLTLSKVSLPTGGATHKRLCREGHVVLNYRFNRSIGNSKCH